VLDKASVTPISLLKKKMVLPISKPLKMVLILEVP